MWIHYRLRRTAFWGSSSVQSCLQIPAYISAWEPSNLRQATSATSFLKNFLSWEQMWQKCVKSRNNNETFQIPFKYPHEFETTHGWSQICLIVCHSPYCAHLESGLALGYFCFRGNCDNPELAAALIHSLGSKAQSLRSFRFLSPLG